MTLSVICPIYNEGKYIEHFLDSILLQDFPEEDMEILLVDGMSNDKTRSIIECYVKKYSVLKLLDNPCQTSPHAMNIGIKYAQGDIIIRLDAHAEYPKNYFSILVRNLERLEGAENVGGVCITLPCNKTATAVAIAECLSNRFGMGNSYFRIGVKDVMSVDTVPFGCFRKSLFDKIGLFDTDMVRNQDDELNGRIIKSGGKIYLLPDVEIKYYARDKIAKVQKMFYQYGLYKPLGNKKLGAPATIRQFFPVLFTIGVVVGLVISLIFPAFAAVYISIALFYLFLGIYEGVKSMKKTKYYSLPILMPYVFYNIHFYYGLGYLKGVFNIMTGRQFNVKSNR